MRIVESKSIYKIGITSSGYVVINSIGDYDNHAHFNTYDGAKACVDFLLKNKMPKSKYILKAMCRLSTGKQKDNLERIYERRKNKEKYINIGCKGGFI